MFLNRQKAQGILVSQSDLRGEGHQDSLVFLIKFQHCQFLRYIDPTILAIPHMQRNPQEALDRWMPRGEIKSLWFALRIKSSSRLLIRRHGTKNPPAEHGSPYFFNSRGIHAHER